MKDKYSKSMENSGSILREEIKPTLELIELITGMSDLSDRFLGSTGKKQESGDIDIAVSEEEFENLVPKLRSYFGPHAMHKQGGMASVVFPIREYNKNAPAVRPRTGFVQVDFIAGDVEFNKIWYFSCEQSKLKGAHRNRAISAVCSELDKISSKETDSFGRPMDTIRWKWSNIGLHKIRRYSEINKNTGNGYIKKQKDEILSTPIKNKKEIVEILFKGKGLITAIDSVENIIKAVKLSCDVTTQNEIFQKAAQHFTEIKNWDTFSYPEEIEIFIRKYD